MKVNYVTVEGEVESRLLASWANPAAVALVEGWKSWEYAGEGSAPEGEKWTSYHGDAFNFAFAKRDDLMPGETRGRIVGVGPNPYTIPKFDADHPTDAELLFASEIPSGISGADYITTAKLLADASHFIGHSPYLSGDLGLFAAQAAEITEDIHRVALALGLQFDVVQAAYIKLVSWSGPRERAKLPNPIAVRDMIKALYTTRKIVVPTSHFESNRDDPWTIYLNGEEA